MTKSHVTACLTQLRHDGLLSSHCEMYQRGANSPVHGWRWASSGNIVESNEKRSERCHNQDTRKIQNSPAYLDPAPLACPASSP
jgi:hypothetical protein